MRGPLLAIGVLVLIAGCSRKTSTTASPAATAGPVAPPPTFDAAGLVADLNAELEADDAEVDNGGFDQFFFNGTGDDSADYGSALRAVGLPSHAAIYDKALAAFPGTPANDTGARRAQMEALQKLTLSNWSKLDDAWYALAKREDVYDALARFANANDLRL